MLQSNFVKSYYRFAAETEKKTGIDARFTLGQAALETGWGRSAPGNMFFGVKASASMSENKRQLLTTTEILNHPNGRFPVIISITKRPDGKYRYRVKDWFRKYDSPEESFTDHANLFLRVSRYHKALAFKDDPYRFAEEIAKAGYATEPTYAERLKGVIGIVEKEINALGYETT